MEWIIIKIFQLWEIKIIEFVNSVRLESFSLIQNFIEIKIPNEIHKNLDEVKEEIDLTHNIETFEDPYHNQDAIKNVYKEIQSYYINEDSLSIHDNNREFYQKRNYQMGKEQNNFQENSSNQILIPMINGVKATVVFKQYIEQFSLLKHNIQSKVIKNNNLQSSYINTLFALDCDHKAIDEIASLINKNANIIKTVFNTITSFNRHYASQDIITKLEQENRLTHSSKYSNNINVTYKGKMIDKLEAEFKVSKEEEESLIQSSYYNQKMGNSGDASLIPTAINQNQRNQRKVRNQKEEPKQQSNYIDPKVNTMTDPLIALHPINSTPNYLSKELKSYFRRSSQSLELENYINMIENHIEPVTKCIKYLTINCNINTVNYFNSADLSNIELLEFNFVNLNSFNCVLSSEFFNNLKSLKCLIIRNCEIHIKELRILESIIKNNNCLKELHLVNNYIDGNESNLLFQTLLLIPNLNTLNLSKNTFNEIFCQNLLEYLSKSLINNLILSDCCLGKQFVNDLIYCQKFHELDISGFCLNEEANFKANLINSKDKIFDVELTYATKEIKYPSEFNNNCSIFATS